MHCCLHQSELSTAVSTNQSSALLSPPITAHLKNLSAPRSVWMWYWAAKSCCAAANSAQLLSSTQDTAWHHHHHHCNYHDHYGDYYHCGHHLGSRSPTWLWLSTGRVSAPGPRPAGGCCQLPRLAPGWCRCRCWCRAQVLSPRLDCKMLPGKLSRKWGGW